MVRMYHDITGIILAGGKSTRMGENKSFLILNGKPAIQNTVDLMKSVFSQVILISNEPDLYEFLGVSQHVDIYKNVGPIAGIHSGLTNSHTRKSFIISCDIPLMTGRMIESIINYPSEADIVVPKADGFIQQLCGIYSNTVLPIIKELIEASIESENREIQQTKRKCKIHQLIHLTKTTIIENTEDMDGYHPEIFYNMNNPEDYNNINKIYRKYLHNPF
jgi:molybdopterin-guanine dinucleotide biosynthesis protein A